jgi:hypothetical protein
VLANTLTHHQAEQPRQQLVLVQLHALIAPLDFLVGFWHLEVRLVGLPGKFRLVLADPKVKQDLEIRGTPAWCLLQSSPKSFNNKLAAPPVAEVLVASPVIWS